MNGRKDESAGFERSLTEALRRSDSPQGECPEVELLAALADQRLSRAERRGLESHLASCARCRETIVLLARAMPEEERKSPLGGLSFWRPMVGALATASIAVALTVRFFPGEAERAVEGVRGEQAAPVAAPEPLPTAPAAPAKTNVDRRNEVRSDRPTRQESAGETLDHFADAEKEQKQVRDERALRPAAPSVGGRMAARSAPALEKRSAPAAKAALPEATSQKREAAPASEPPPAAEEPAASAFSAPGAKAKGDAALYREQEADGGNAAPAELAVGAATVRGPTGAWRIADGTLEQSSDGGRTWRAVSLGSDVELAALATTGDRSGWVVGARGTVFRTTDGKNWNRCETPTDEDLLGIGALDRERAVVTARSGARFETLDGGTTWSTR